jgi:hypothetical protein
VTEAGESPTPTVLISREAMGQTCVGASATYPQVNQANRLVFAWRNQEKVKITSQTAVNGNATVQYNQRKTSGAEEVILSGHKAHTRIISRKKQAKTLMHTTAQITRPGRHDDSNRCHHRNTALLGATLQLATYTCRLDHRAKQKKKKTPSDHGSTTSFPPAVLFSIIR